MDTDPAPEPEDNRSYLRDQLDQLPDYWKRIESLSEGTQVALALLAIAVVVVVGVAVLWVVSTILHNLAWIVGGAGLVYGGWFAIQWRRLSLEEEAARAEAAEEQTRPTDDAPPPPAATIPEAPPQRGGRGQGRRPPAPAMTLTGPVPPGEPVPVADVQRMIATLVQTRRDAARARADAEEALQQTEASLRLRKKLNVLAIGLLTIPVILANRRRRALADRIAEATARERGAQLELLVYCDPSARATFDEVAKTYRDLARSEYVWNVDGDDRRRIYLLRLWPIGIRADRNNCCSLADTDAASLAIFHGLVVAARGDTTLVAPLAELGLHYETRQLIERKRPPGDARVVGKRWEHALPDGSRDERVADNRQYPVVEYGVLRWSVGDLQQTVMFSDEAGARAFHEMLDGYLAHLRVGKTHIRHGGDDLELEVWLQLPE